VSVSVNGWNNLHETWYVYQGTCAHLNGVLHKPLRPVCVSLCTSPLSLLRNGSVNTFPRQRIHTQQYNNCWTRLFYAVRVIPKESRRLVVPRSMGQLWLKASLNRILQKYCYQKLICGITLFSNCYNTETSRICTVRVITVTLYYRGTYIHMRRLKLEASYVTIKQRALLEAGSGSRHHHQDGCLWDGRGMESAQGDGGTRRDDRSQSLTFPPNDVTLRYRQRHAHIKMTSKQKLQIRSSYMDSVPSDRVSVRSSSLVTNNSILRGVNGSKERERERGMRFWYEKEIGANTLCRLSHLRLALTTFTLERKLIVVRKTTVGYWKPSDPKGRFRRNRHLVLESLVLVPLFSWRYQGAVRRRSPQITEIQSKLSEPFSRSSSFFGGLIWRTPVFFFETEWTYSVGTDMGRTNSYMPNRNITYSTVQALTRRPDDIPKPSFLIREGALRVSVKIWRSIFHHHNGLSCILHVRGSATYKYTCICIRLTCFPWNP
jgi:hypothetical protein